jgi:hypothetical protein
VEALLVEVLLVDADWLCAAISALMVCGEICDAVLQPVGSALAVDDVLLSEMLNGLLDAWFDPEDDPDDDDEVSDCSASIAVETAEMAMNMANSIQSRPTRHACLPVQRGSKRRAIGKGPVK